jgi:hypothetical protein|tara:strand:+ start:505 stop:693 length:189 start_codon:yes stop_codon:yes gene_type:complete
MNLEKVGITLPLDDLKEVKTNKDLAIEQLETIVGWMRDKKAGPNSYLDHYASMIESQIRWLK